MIQVHGNLKSYQHEIFGVFFFFFVSVKFVLVYPSVLEWQVCCEVCDEQLSLSLSV